MDTTLVENGVAILAALVSGATGLLGSKWWKQWRLAQRKRDVVAGIISLHRVYQTMVEMQDIGASRVMLLAGHNSGGIPRPGAGFWVSAIHWVAHKRNVHTAFEHYANIPVDAHYVKLLIDAEQYDYVNVKVDTMPPCLLKTFYEAEGVTDALFLHVGITENKMLFLSAARYDGHFTEEQITHLVLKTRVITQEVVGPRA